MSAGGVRVLGQADASAAAALLVRGFAEDPAKVAVLADPATRRVVLGISASTMLHGPLRYGTAHAALVGDELAAIAVWLPPGVPKITLTGAARAVPTLLSNAPVVARALWQAAGVALRDAGPGIALMRERPGAVARASRGRAWYLALLATAPEHRGTGLARSLLERQLRRCDEDGAAAWLETTNPANPPIYERFGFATVARIHGPAWLPGLWVMRREAHMTIDHGH